MSNVIKLNSAISQKLSVRFKNELDDIKEDKELKQNQFQIQLEQQYEQGFKNGYENAKVDIEKLYSEKLIKKVEEFNKILGAIDEKIANYDEEFENLVVRLSFEIAQKIVRREIKQESPIENVLKDSLKKILGANSVIIKIHPEDFKVINDEYSKNLFFDESFSKIKFEQDDRIEQGGCAVETEIGNVDARVTSQLNELKKYFETSLNFADKLTK
jgi:flagellar assembly protein FliH